MQERAISAAVASRHLGQPIERVEDAALLRGEGRFIDDLGLAPGTLHAAFLRSPIAHGHIRSIDAGKALRLPGVAAVVTGADIARFARPFTVGVKAPMQHWALAVDRVRHVGEPVAIVCADTPYLAEDGAALIDVDYETLPVAVDPGRATLADAPLLHEAVGSNIVSNRQFVYGGTRCTPSPRPPRSVIEIKNSLSAQFGSTPIECFRRSSPLMPPTEALTTSQTHFQRAP